MLCKFMINDSQDGNLYGSCINTEKRWGNITRNAKISQQPSKPYNLCTSSSKCLKFCLLERDTDACFLEFHAIGEEPRRMQYPVMECRSVGSLAQLEPSKHEAEVNYHEHKKTLR